MPTPPSLPAVPAAPPAPGAPRPVSSPAPLPRAERAPTPAFTPDLITAATARWAAVRTGEVDPTSLAAAELAMLAAAAPVTIVSASATPAGGLDLLDLLLRAELAPSRAAAQRLLDGQAVRLNGRVLPADQTRVGSDGVLHGEWILLAHGDAARLLRFVGARDV